MLKTISIIAHLSFTTDLPEFFFLESIVECLLAALFRKDNVLQNVYLEQIFGAYEMKHFTSLLEIKICFTNKNLNLDVLQCPPFFESKNSGYICC